MSKRKREDYEDEEEDLTRLKKKVKRLEKENRKRLQKKRKQAKICERCKKESDKFQIFYSRHFDEDEDVSNNDLCGLDHPEILCWDCHLELHGCRLCYKTEPACDDYGALCGDCEYLLGRLFEKNTKLRDEVRKLIPKVIPKWYKLDKKDKYKF